MWSKWVRLGRHCMCQLHHLRFFVVKMSRKRFWSFARRIWKKRKQGVCTCVGARGLANHCQWRKCNIIWLIGLKRYMITATRVTFPELIMVFCWVFFRILNDDLVLSYCACQLVSVALLLCICLLLVWFRNMPCRFWKPLWLPLNIMCHKECFQLARLNDIQVTMYQFACYWIILPLSCFLNIHDHEVFVISTRQVFSSQKYFP